MMVKDLATMTPAEIDAQLAEVWNELYPLLDERDGHTERGDEARQARVLARIEQLRQQTKPLEYEWMNRRWSRFYRVNRTDGHIHRNRHCSTCGPRTQFLWLVELAGKSDEQMLAELGRDAWLLCTVCFPEAPVLDKPLKEGQCDGTPAPGQNARINKKCGKCAHVGVARNWRKHKAK